MTKDEQYKIGDARHLKDEIKDLVGNKLPIVVDFDGTVVKHHYPEIGETIKHCVETLKKWSDNGVGIILDTMRSGKDLEAAKEWFKDNGIPLYGVGADPKQKEWTDSPKAYGILSVDDRNLGVPLVFEEGERPYVDWNKIDKDYSEIIIKMAKNNVKIEEVIKTLKELKEENHRLEVENEELKEVFSKVLQLFNNDKESFFKAIKGETINKTNNMHYNIANKEYNPIDLGLPSGTLWMDRNVGASSPEDAGLYFAWGETTGYTADEVGKTKQFSWDNYKFGSTLTKYNSKDSLTKLDTKDDSVLQNTHKFKMPTKEQLQELIDNTTSTWTTQNGVNGRLFTSKTNGNSIFVPAAGYGNYGSMYHVGSVGYLWSSSLYEDYTSSAWYLNFYSGGVDLYDDGRCDGRSVRGVSNN